jgi:hypothetical protein
VLCVDVVHAVLCAVCCVLMSVSADIVKEVAIMRLLADHPNTVQLHQVGCVQQPSVRTAPGFFTLSRLLLSRLLQLMSS